MGHDARPWRSRHRGGGHCRCDGLEVGTHRGLARGRNDLDFGL
jgi:hypothetical protein